MSRSAGGSHPVRVYVIDDHAQFLRSLAHFVQDYAEVELAGTSLSEAEALPHLHELHPDVLVLDPPMRDLESGDMVRRFRAAFPEMGLVVLTMHDEERFRESAQQAGADAFVSKLKLEEALLPAIRRAARY